MRLTLGFHRQGGDFYWRQAYNTMLSGCAMLYTAMFDEMDEDCKGTCNATGGVGVDSVIGNSCYGTCTTPTSITCKYNMP